MNASSDAPGDQTTVTPYKFKLGQTIIFWFLGGFILAEILVNHHPGLTKGMPAAVEYGLMALTAAAYSAMFTGFRYAFRNRLPNHGRWLIIAFAGASAFGMWSAGSWFTFVAFGIALVLGLVLDFTLPMPEPGSSNPYDQ